jgi:hypothetical protein
MLGLLTQRKHLHNMFTTCTMKSINEFKLVMPNIKLKTNLHRHHTEFSIGDYVMVQIKPKQFPPGSVRKLQACNVRPFKVCSRSDEMHMSLTFPSDHSISSTFNVKELVAYIGQLVMLDDPFKDPLSDPNNPILDPVQPSLPPVHKGYIDAIWMSRFFYQGWRSLELPSSLGWSTRFKLQIDQ